LNALSINEPFIAEASAGDELELFADSGAKSAKGPTENHSTISLDHQLGTPHLGIATARFALLRSQTVVLEQKPLDFECRSKSAAIERAHKVGETVFAESQWIPVNQNIQ
jgi:hypothetical protein